MPELMGPEASPLRGLPKRVQYTRTRQLTTIGQSATMLVKLGRNVRRTERTREEMTDDANGTIASSPDDG